MRTSFCPQLRDDLAASTRRNKMALPTNDDFSNRELSVDELDAIAGGFSLGGLIHSIEHGLKSFFTNPVVAKIAFGIVAAGAIVTGASTAHRQN
jgi:hypothetical protein